MCRLRAGETRLGQHAGARRGGTKGVPFSRRQPAGVREVCLSYFARPARPRGATRGNEKEREPEGPRSFEIGVDSPYGLHTQPAVIAAVAHIASQVSVQQVASTGAPLLLQMS
jgi:hypothetical protein